MFSAGDLSAELFSEKNLSAELFSLSLKLVSVVSKFTIPMDLMDLQAKEITISIVIQFISASSTKNYSHKTADVHSQSMLRVLLVVMVTQDLTDGL